MATKRHNAAQDATLPQANQANAALGLAPWTRTGTGIAADSSAARSSKAGVFRRLDMKRILAMSAVLVTHTMLFGAMLLPAAPIAAIQLPPPEPPWVDVSETPPPPPKPPILLIPREPPTPRPEVQPVVVNTPPPVAPVIEAPILVATTQVPTEEPPSVFNPKIVDKPATVGGNLGESIVKVLRAPAPRYPIDIIRKGISGTVEFSVLVGVDGSAQQIKLMKTSGNRKLDQFTLSHIKRHWRFKAPEVDGQVVPGWGRGKVIFTLEG